MTDTTHSRQRTLQSAERQGIELTTQYSAKRVLATWAAATVPMAVLAWGVAPRLADALHGPTALSRALVLSLTAGMVWEFLLVLILVRREQGTLRWSVVTSALWLRPPRSPRTGKRGGRTWCVLIPRCRRRPPVIWVCSSAPTPVDTSCRATGCGWPSSSSCSP